MAYWSFVIVRTLVVEYDRIVSLGDITGTFKKAFKGVKREDVFVFNSV